MGVERTLSFLGGRRNPVGVTSALNSFTDLAGWFTSGNHPFARNRLFPIARQCNMKST